MNGVYANVGLWATVFICAMTVMFFLWLFAVDNRELQHRLARRTRTGTMHRVYNVLSEEALAAAKTQPVGRRRLENADPNYAVDPWADFGTNEYNWNYDWDERHYHDDGTARQNQSVNALSDDDEFETWDGASGWDVPDLPSSPQPQPQPQPSTDVTLPNHEYTRHQIMYHETGSSSYLPETTWWRTSAGSTWLQPVRMEDILNAQPPRADGQPHVVDAPVSPAPQSPFTPLAQRSTGRHSVLTAPGTDAQRALLTGTMEMKALTPQAMWDLVEPPRELVGVTQ